MLARNEKTNAGKSDERYSLGCGDSPCGRLYRLTVLPTIVHSTISSDHHLNVDCSLQIKFVLLSRHTKCAEQNRKTENDKAQYPLQNPTYRWFRSIDEDHNALRLVRECRLTKSKAIGVTKRGEHIAKARYESPAK